MKIYSAQDVINIAYAEHGVVGTGKPPRKVTTGFGILDSKFGGLSPGELTIIAARRNTGKSTVALHMARAMDAAGHRPGIISLEDSPTTIGERIQSFLSRIDPIDIRLNGPSHRGSDGVARAVNDSSRFNTKFFFLLGGGLKEVIAGMDQLAAAGCDAIIIDYFTAIENDNGLEARMGFNKMLIHMKAHALHLKVPLVLMCQVGRPQSGTNPKSEPYMNELAETRYLEDKAEVVVMFWIGEDGVTRGKLEKLKYSRRDMPKFYVYLDEKTGFLTTEEYVEVPEYDDKGRKTVVEVPKKSFMNGRRRETYTNGAVT